MAKNQTTKNSKGVSEKMKNSFSISHFQSLFGISNHQSNNAPNPPVQTNSAKAYVSQSKGDLVDGNRAHKYAGDNKIPILVHTESGPAKPHILVQKHGKAAKMSTTNHAAGKEDKIKILFGMMNKQGRNAVSKVDQERQLSQAPVVQLKPRMERAGSDLGTESWTTNGVDDNCSEYIHRVKDNMGTGSDHGTERTAAKLSRRDSFNDRLNSFLNRTRIKMRTTSSNVGDFKSISFNRRSANDR